MAPKGIDKNEEGKNNNVTIDKVIKDLNVESASSNTKPSDVAYKTYGRYKSFDIFSESIGYTPEINGTKNNLTGANFNCRFPQCGFKGANDYLLKNHIAIIHMNQNVKLTCTECKYSTKHKSFLDLHTKIAHQGGEALDKICMECTMAFASNRTLENHLRVVHNKTLKPFKCEKCSILRTFDTRNEFEIHHDITHKTANSNEMEGATNKDKSEGQDAILETPANGMLFLDCHCINVKNAVRSYAATMIWKNTI